MAKFLLIVLVLTIASAIGLIILHFTNNLQPAKTGGAGEEKPAEKKPEETKASNPAPDPKPEPAPQPPANPNPNPKPPGDPIWWLIDHEFDELEKQVQTWNPASSIDVVRTIRGKIVRLARELETKK